MGFLAWLASGALTPLLNLISPITNAITAIFTKKEDVLLEKYKVDGQLDMTVVEAHAAILKNQWYALLQALFAVPLAFYYGKVHIWDAALHLGSTDAIR